MVLKSQAKVIANEWGETSRNVVLVCAKTLTLKSS